jgi:hypothetical protein
VHHATSYVSEIDELMQLSLVQILHKQCSVAYPIHHLGRSCHADGLTPEYSTSESDTVLRSAHLEQDEAIRQDNRQKAQQQKATTGYSGQVSGPNGQASPIVAELQRENDEANRQVSQ